MVGSRYWLELGLLEDLLRRVVYLVVVTGHPMTVEMADVAVMRSGVIAVLCCLWAKQATVETEC